jgi:aminoglycoside phosphotransferase (APT) family kinase protein
VQDQSQWKKAHSLISKKLGHLQDIWRSRSIRQWLHGDLHMANAMCRSDAPDSQVSLIDLAEVHAGHWVEDAVYLERQLWGHKTRLKATKPVHAMAVARKQHGMIVEDDYSNLVDVRRLLLAATATAFMQSEGDPRYLAACLTQLENAIDRLHLK